MKKAVMYGGGNIGRGFIGALLSQSGYEVTFIDVAEPVINHLKEHNKYPIRIVSTEGYEDVWVEHVTAVNGNLPEAVDAIAECDIMATAVGARILKFIVPNIVAGLRKRWEMGKGALNIIICENLNNANEVLEGMLKAALTEEECKNFSGENLSGSSQFLGSRPRAQALMKTNGPDVMSNPFITRPIAIKSVAIASLEINLFTKKKKRVIYHKLAFKMCVF